MNCHPCVRNGPEGDGRGEWIRTTDPSVPNRVLYQAEPRPDRRKVRLTDRGPGSRTRETLSYPSFQLKR